MSLHNALKVGRSDLRQRQQWSKPWADNIYRLDTRQWDDFHLRWGQERQHDIVFCSSVSHVSDLAQPSGPPIPLGSLSTFTLAPLLPFSRLLHAPLPVHCVATNWRCYSLLTLSTLTSLDHRQASCLLCRLLWCWYVGSLPIFQERHFSLVDNKDYTTHVYMYTTSCWLIRAFI